MCCRWPSARRRAVMSCTWKIRQGSVEAASAKNPQCSDTQMSRPCRSRQRRAVAPQKGAQGPVGLQDAALDRDQRHADGRVGEGALEALLAELELAQMLRGPLSFPLGRVH